MKILDSILNFIFRVLWFAIGGLLYGIVIGIVTGIAASFLLSILMLIANVRVAPGAAPPGAAAPAYAIRPVIQFIYACLVFGGGIGGFIGGVMGIISFVVVGISVSHRSHQKKDFFKAVAGGFRGACVFALGGSCSGALFFALYEIFFGVNSSQKVLEAAFAPFLGGFFKGSIAGFCIGFFVGTLIGGLSREPNWLTMPLGDVRVEIKAKIRGLWKDEYAK